MCDYVLIEGNKNIPLYVFSKQVIQVMISGFVKVVLSLTYMY